MISFFSLKEELKFHSHASVKVNSELVENIPNSFGSILPFQNDANNTFETEILQILESRDFIMKLVQEKDILINLVATGSFNEKKRTLEINEDRFDESKKTWVGLYADINDGIKLERYQMIKEIFSEGLEITKVGPSFYEITYSSNSPSLSYDIVSTMIYKLNDYYRSFEIQRAKKKINFLEAEYEKAQVVELKSSITAQISQQIERLVSLNASDELALITIDSTSLDTYESAAKKRVIYEIVRSLMVFIFFIFLAVLFAFLGYKIRVVKNYPFIIHEKI